VKTPLTAAGWRAIDRALRRSGQDGRAPFVCPTPWGPAAELAVLKRLTRDGFITDEPSPVVTDAGRTALSAK
jgi:hypothetical protein